MDYNLEYEKYLDRMEREIISGNIERKEVKILDFEDFKGELENEIQNRRRKTKTAWDTCKKWQNKKAKNEKRAA